MTSHGFGFVRFMSEKLSPNIIEDLAKRISEMRPVVWAHVVLDKSEEYSVVFEFDELSKPCYDMNHAGLKKRIETLKMPDGHHISVDLWVIRRSFHNGC